MTWTEMTKEQRVEAIRPLWMRGDSAGMIAREFGVTRSVIIGLVHRNLKGIRPGQPSSSLRRRRSPSPPLAPSLNSMKPRPVGRPRKDSPPPLPRPAPIVVADLPQTGTVDFLDRRSGQCAYPMWPATESIGLCCGRPASEGSSYCPEHHRLCRVKPERTSLGRHVAAVAARMGE